METSAFSEFGLLEFTSGEPLSKRIYDTIWASLGKNYAKGGHVDAAVYATSMGLARFITMQRRLEEQILPETTLELLTEREAEYGMGVPVSATLTDRRRALAAQMRLGAGNTMPLMLQALQDLLGSAFVSYTPTPIDSVVLNPSDPATGPGNHAAPGSPKRMLRLVDNVSGIGLNTTAIGWRYGMPQGGPMSDADMLKPGEWVVVEGEHGVLRERVQIVSSTRQSESLALGFALLTKPHHANASLILGRWPYWLSNRRQSIVRVTPEAAADAEVMRALNGLLAKISRASSTWAITDSEGPMLADTSPSDTTPFVPLFV